MVSRYPVIETGVCSLCLGCLESAPSIFFFNEMLNMVQVRDLENYEEQGVAEAILLCPRDCIRWENNFSDK